MYFRDADVRRENREEAAERWRSRRDPRKPEDLRIAASSLRLQDESKHVEIQGDWSYRNLLRVMMRLWGISIEGGEGQAALVIESLIPHFIGSHQRRSVPSIHLLLLYHCQPHSFSDDMPPSMKAHLSTQSSKYIDVTNAAITYLNAETTFFGACLQSLSRNFILSTFLQHPTAVRAPPKRCHT